MVLCFLKTDLQVNNRLNELKLLFEQRNLGLVRISKVVGLKVVPDGAMHHICNDLHKALLGHRTRNMFIALNINLAQPRFMVLESSLKLKQVMAHLMPVP